MRLSDAGHGNKMVKLHEASELTGVSYFTIWRAVQRGELVASRRSPTGKFKVRLVDLREWLRLRDT